MPLIPFTLGKWKSLATRTWTEDDTIAGFFDEAAGTTVEVTYDQGTNWRGGFPPQVARQDGAALYGVIAHLNLCSLTPNAFSIVYERVSDGVYVAQTGDLDVTLTRHGRSL